MLSTQTQFSQEVFSLEKNSRFSSFIQPCPKSNDSSQLECLSLSLSLSLEKTDLNKIIFLSFLHFLPLNSFNSL